MVKLYLDDILKKISKEKTFVKKTYAYAVKLGYGSANAKRVYNQQIKTLDKKYEKAKGGVKQKGFKDLTQSEKKFIEYRRLVAKQNENFNNKQMGLLSEVSDGGQVVEHIFKIGNEKEINKELQFQKNYEKGKLTKKQITNEIARLKSREKRNVFENRNTKIQVKRALHKNLERQWLEQQAANGNGKFLKDGSFQMNKNLSDTYIDVFNAKCKNLQHSFKTMTPEQYMLYYAKKVGREGKYVEGLEYDYKTEQFVGTGEGRWIPGSDE